MVWRNTCKDAQHHSLLEKCKYYNEVSPHSSQNSHKKSTNNSYTVRKNVNWYNHYRERNGESLKKTMTKTTIWPSNPTIGHILGENHNSKRHIYPNVHCNTVYISYDTKATKKSIIDEWIKNCGTFI